MKMASVTQSVCGDFHMVPVFVACKTVKNNQSSRLYRMQVALARGVSWDVEFTLDVDPFVPKQSSGPNL